MKKYKIEILLEYYSDDDLKAEIEDRLKIICDMSIDGNTLHLVDIYITERN